MLTVQIPEIATELDEALIDHARIPQAYLPLVTCANTDRGRHETPVSGVMHLPGAASPVCSPSALGISPGHDGQRCSDVQITNPKPRPEAEIRSMSNLPSGWMALGALTFLIVSVSISAAFPHLFLR